MALFRLCGTSMLLGSVLLVITNLNPFDLDSNLATRVASATWLPAQVVGVCGALLILLGLPGVYALQAGRAGVLGLVAFGLAFLSMALDLVGGFSMNAFILPALAARSDAQDFLAQPPRALELYLFAMFLLLVVSLILFGIATIRAGVLPRAAGVLVVLGTIGDLVGGFVFHSPVSFGAAIACVGFGWMGYALLIRSEIAEVPLRAGTAAAVV